MKNDVFYSGVRKRWCSKLFVVTLSLCMVMGACKYDDGEIWDKVNKLENRVADIERKLSEINTNISSLSTIVSALQDKVYVESIESKDEGYLLTFSDGKTALITHGKDAPVVTIAKSEEDDQYYWMRIDPDGTKYWLIDPDTDEKIPANGEDGNTPKMKIDDEGYWNVSYDNGDSYELLNDAEGNPIKAVGEDGVDGLSFIGSIRIEGNNLILVLNSGEELTIPFASGEVEEEEENPINDSYFSIEDTPYVASLGEDVEVTELLTGVDLNANVLPGGASIATISTEEKLKDIYVGVEGEMGYYRLNADEYLVSEPVEVSRTAQNYVYSFTMFMNQQLDANFNINIILHTITNNFLSWRQEMDYMQAGTGDLQVSLAFSNAKDVDLYVVEPNGNIVYYGNRRPWLFDSSNYEEEDYDRQVGLDIDSNAGCSIDNINKENIYFDSNCLQKGTYQVWVNMYSNCDESIATDWSIVTTYKGVKITPEEGVNPANGTFPVGTPSNHISNSLSGATYVMSFTINEGQDLSAESRSVLRNIEEDLTESAKKKLLLAGVKFWE